MKEVNLFNLFRVYLIFGFLFLGVHRFKFSYYRRGWGSLDAAAAKESGSRFNIKIVEGLPKKKNTYTHSSTPVEPTPSRVPHSIPALTPLNYLTLMVNALQNILGAMNIKSSRNVTQLDR